MRPTTVLLLCALALSACGKTPRVHVHAREPGLHLIAPEMKITLEQAIAAAAKASPGTPVDAGLESYTEADKREVYVSVTLVDGKGAVQTVKIDSASGNVLASGPETDAAAAGEAKAVADAIGTAHLALGDLVARGEKALGGKALKARFVTKDGKTAARVRGLVGTEMQSVALDPKTGAVETAPPAAPQTK